MQALVKLQDKRVAVEKVVLHYGEAPSGIKEVFELCRGFERAYVNLVNVSLLGAWSVCIRCFVMCMQAYSACSCLLRPLITHLTRQVPLQQSQD